MSEGTVCTTLAPQGPFKRIQFQPQNCIFSGAGVGNISA